MRKAIFVSFVRTGSGLRVVHGEDGNVYPFSFRWTVENFHKAIKRGDLIVIMTDARRVKYTADHVWRLAKTNK